MKKATFSGLLMLAFSLLSACAAAPPSSEPLVEPLLPSIERQTAAPTASLPERAPTEFPSAALAARNALAELLGVKAEEIEIRSVQSVTWPDGCLGLAKSDEMCTMAIVPGYRVMLVFGREEHTYRTDETGRVLRHEMSVLKTPRLPEKPSLIAWQNVECTEQALLLPEGLSIGDCEGTHTLLEWENGEIPPVASDWLTQLAPFYAQTPAGTVAFSGQGMQTASPAEQRAIAEWLKIRFLAAQSGRPQADWGLALTYAREGGFAGFCDTLKIYLDGSALLSSCKDVDVDLRLNAEQLEQLYAWYDHLEKIDYSYTDPGVADAMSTKLTMPAQGSQAADDVIVNEILAFCAELLRQARVEP